MNLAISNIAWPRTSEPAVAEVLQKLGVSQVEIAPTAVWDNPLETTADERKVYRDFWLEHGITIVGMQSLLYGQPDLTIFEDVAKREATYAYLAKVITVAGDLGITALVFGSPKNRLRGELSLEETQTIAVDFFRKVGDVAVQYGVVFGIEPNPTEYGCDYITNASEGLSLVKAIAHPGIGLHLDAAALRLANDPLPESIAEALPHLCHFHISEPQLAPVGDPDSEAFHRQVAAALQSAQYQKTVSIEMKTLPEEMVLSGVEKAVRFSQSIYS